MPEDLADEHQVMGLDPSGECLSEFWEFGAQGPASQVSQRLRGHAHQRAAPPASADR
jgi:hypothetical protein